MQINARADVDKPEHRWGVATVYDLAALRGFFAGVHYLDDYSTGHFDFNKNYKEKGFETAKALMDGSEIRVGELFYTVDKAIF